MRYNLGIWKSEYNNLKNKVNSKCNLLRKNIMNNESKLEIMLHQINVFNDFSEHNYLTLQVDERYTNIKFRTRIEEF